MKPVDLSIDDYQETVAVFHEESDRAAVVLAGGFVESYIAKFIRSHMIDSKEVDSLFEGFGPFSTYAQRVQTAFAFGLISKMQKDDLVYIGKIRNLFAHHPLKASFTDQQVSSWCGNLSTANLFPNDDQPENEQLNNRHRLILAVSFLVTDWHNAMLKMQLSGK